MGKYQDQHDDSTLLLAATWLKISGRGDRRRKQADDVVDTLMDFEGVVMKYKSWLCNCELDV